MAEIALIIGAVAGVAGTVLSYKAQKKAAKVSQQQQALATRQQRREAIRRQQLTRAQTVASASAQGATGSSAVEGGMSSLGSQLGGQMGYSTQMSGLSRDIAKYQSRAQTWGAVASLGNTAFNYGQANGATFGSAWNSFKGTTP